MPTKAVSAQLAEKIQRLSQYSGIPFQVLEQRVFALEGDLDAKEDIVDQQLYCYMASEFPDLPNQTLPAPNIKQEEFAVQ